MTSTLPFSQLCQRVVPVTLTDERQKNLYLCGLQSDLKRAPGWDEPAAIGLEPVLYPLCCGCLRTLLTPSSLRVVLG